MDQLRSSSLSFSDHRRWEIYFSVTSGVSYDYLSDKFECDESTIKLIYETTLKSSICEAMLNGKRISEKNNNDFNEKCMMFPIIPLTQYKWRKFRNTKNQNQEKNKFLNEKRKKKLFRYSRLYTKM